MTASLLRVCAADRSLRFLHDHRRLARPLSSAGTASTTAILARPWLRKTTTRPAPSVHSPIQHRHRRRRSNHHRKDSLTKISVSIDSLDRCRIELDMASNQEFRRRPSVADKSSPIDSSSPISTATTTTLFSPTPDKTSPHEFTTNQLAARPARIIRHGRHGSEAMPPPPVPVDGSTSRTRRPFGHVRSRSSTSASRHANRLSLTLPIAVPLSDSSRLPTSISASSITSIPQSPLDTPDKPDLSDPNDFIIAIAAQERKVLELREELSRAEAELVALKRQWTSKEAFNKRAETVSMESPLATPIPDEAASPTRQSIDIDRRKMLLQNQGASPATPTQNRRRVLRGGHTRTLSLLSPVRNAPSFTVHEDSSIDIPAPTQQEPRKRPESLQGPPLVKRTSWQPRTQPVPTGVPQLVEDFKVGLRAFVEDIRQITVGDEPMGGQSSKVSSSQEPLSTGERETGPESDRSKRRSANLSSEKANDVIAAPARAKTIKQKQFSWTPLGFDALDDDDWSNWDSPMSNKSTRWSGSTAHGGVTEEIYSAEAAEDAETPLKARKTTTNPLLPPKFEELLPSMVNKLSPSNIKRATSHLMDEWEKSLIPPEERNKENTPKKIEA